MNFLAHIYLSGESDLIKIGNFMADGIRGKDYETLHPEIQKGVILHRAIDTFTDAHPLFRQSTRRLHEKYHHYAGVIVDMFYDHFLARNWSDYSDEKLESFIQRFYTSLENNRDLLTEKTRGMMPYMIRHNWLWNYQFVDGIGKFLYQMDNRTRNNSQMKYSVAELQEHYTEFGQEFKDFFVDMRAHAIGKRAGL